MTGHVSFLTLSSKPWGAQHSLGILVNEMSKLGVKSSVVCESADVAEFFAKHDCTPVLLEKRGGRLRSLARFYRYASRTSADALVLFSPALTALVYPLQILRRRWPRILVDLHDTPRGKLDRTMMSLFLRRVDRVICISRYVQDYAGPNARTIVVERPIVTPEVPTQSTSEPSVLKIGIVGRIDPEKRLELGIEAVSQLDASARLVIYGRPYMAGDGYLEQVMATGIARLGSDRFEYAGHRPIAEIMSDIDVLVSANPYEPSGRTVAEAMVHGIPVVVPDAGGTGEQVVDGATGLVYSAEDSESLADKLRELQNDRDLRIRLAETAQAQVTSRRSPERIAREYKSAVFFDRLRG